MNTNNHSVKEPTPKHSGSADHIPLQPAQPAKPPSLLGRAITLLKFPFQKIGIISIICQVFSLSFYILSRITPSEGIKKASIVCAKVFLSLGLITLLYRHQLEKNLGMSNSEYSKKKNVLNPYFLKLSQIAKDAGCNSALCQLLTKGAEIRANIYINENLDKYYDTFIESKLKIICEKLEKNALNNEEKQTIIEMFKPKTYNKKDHGDTGIYACCPGFGRLLEQICDVLDVPQDNNKIIPWLIAQYKTEIINLIAMNESSKKYLSLLKDIDVDIPKDSIFQKYLKYDEVHFGNLLVNLIGKEIGLPNDVIQFAAKDPWGTVIRFSSKEKDDLLKMYKTKFQTKEAVEFLKQRVNSQPDGRPGLKGFREFAIQKLTENVSDQELESSKNKLMQQGVSKNMADDPSMYVQFHYFQNPHSKPSDENHSDLNEAGINKFLEIQKINL